MPLMIDVKRAVVFGGERGEGLQKTEKLSLFADELFVVPEREVPAAFIVLEPGRLPHVGENLILEKRRVVPIAPEPASISTIGEYLSGASFVVSDLVDRRLNEAISSACASRGILCNVIDTKDLCSTWFMSLVHTGHLLAGVSTKGRCAYYARKLREELELEFDEREPVAEILVELRERMPELLPAGLTRTMLLDAVYLDNQFREFVSRSAWSSARRRADEVFSTALDRETVAPYAR